MGKKVPYRFNKYGLFRIMNETKRPTIVGRSLCVKIIYSLTVCGLFLFHQ
jgi:hypothetical protein